MHSVSIVPQRLVDSRVGRPRALAALRHDVLTHADAGAKMLLVAVAMLANRVSPLLGRAIDTRLLDGRRYRRERVSLPVLFFLALAAITLGCGSGNKAELQSPQFVPPPVVSAEVSAALAPSSAPAGQATAVLQFAELPELCRQIIADEASYSQRFGWRGCALCTRAVGMSLADARAYFSAASDPAFLEAQNLKHVANRNE